MRMRRAEDLDDERVDGRVDADEGCDSLQGRLERK